MNSVEWLQRWRLAQCNDTWEHAHGVFIETLDNPGWLVKIDLTETSLKDKPFDGFGQADAANHAALAGYRDWLSCKKEAGFFIGAGGLLALEAIRVVFRQWAET